MLLEVSSLGPQPPVGTATDLLVCPGSPVIVTLRLGATEALHSATLVLRRTEGAGLAGPSILHETSAGGPVLGVEWIAAGWGDPRRLRGLTLAMPLTIEPPRLRVLVDRGDGIWRLLPNEPTTTAISTGDTTRLHVTLAAVATRVRVELEDEQGEPMTADLNELEPLSLDLGNEPEDLRLTIRGCELPVLLGWDGPLPEGEGLVLEELLAQLPDEAIQGPPDAPLMLELRAQIAGDLELWWSFSTTATDSARSPSGPLRRLQS